MFLKNRLTVMLAAIMIFLVMLPVFNVRADTISIGASPMLFSNLNIHNGHSRKLNFVVVNKSQFPKNQGEAGVDRYTYRVHIAPVAKKINNKTIDSKVLDVSSWVSLDSNNFILKPGKSKNVSFTVNVPENAGSGEYLIALDITEKKKTNNNKINVNLSSALEIPLFIEVKGNSKAVVLKKSYNLKDFSITDTVNSETIGGILSGLFIPNGRIFKNWCNLLGKPIKITKDGRNLYDVKKVKVVYMKDVITSQKDGTSDKKYIYVPKELIADQVVDNINFSGKKIYVTTQGKQYTIITPSTQVCQNIRDQITALASKIEKKPTIDYIYNSVLLNQDIKQKENRLYFKYKVQNTGTETIVPKGEVGIFDGKKLVYKVPYSSTVIMPKQTKEIIAEVTYNNLNTSNKTYTVVSNIKPYNSAKNIAVTNDIRFVHIRIFIIVGCLLFMAIVISIFIFIIKKIIKVRKTKALNKLTETAVE